MIVFGLFRCRPLLFPHFLQEVFVPIASLVVNLSEWEGSFHQVPGDVVEVCVVRDDAFG